MILVFAVIAIISAFICYTIGVWSEKIAGRLKLWHLSFFYVGFIFDTIGTSLMGIISGKFSANIHGITGLLAIILMAFHVVWASIVLYRKNEKLITAFHKFSLIVWLIWLIPFLTGMILNMK